jgi:hypothetical protein
MHSQNGPRFVSPGWIMDSWQAGELLDTTQYTPQYRQIVKVQKADQGKLTKASTLLKGALFALMRVSPPSWAVDYDQNELEKIIRSHGGQLLSLKLLEAFKVDRVGADKQKQRMCYVVCWGSYTRPHLDIHPLLAQVKRHNLCEMLEVTPLWLRTCLSEDRLLSASGLPMIFTPSSRPIYCLTKDDDKCSTPPRISITGFSGSRRTAIIHLVQAMGADYMDSMSKNTTHLICREASGQKYDKAVQWKLHIVTVDWLYFIAENGLSTGSESKYKL